MDTEPPYGSGVSGSRMPRWELAKMVNIVLMNLILPSHYLLKGLLNFLTGYTGTVTYFLGVCLYISG